MSSEGTAVEAALAPDEAFALLGNETRLAILRALSDADDPTAFSELRASVGVSDSGQFNYHLDQLVGPFVADTGDGYRLRQAGRRVIEAILSGTVTQAPELGPTTIDEQCHYCGAPVAVRYAEERVRIYCTQCEGSYTETPAADAGVVPDDYGYLGAMLLPPAGVAGRSPEATYRAAWNWGHVEVLAMASGICPRCSADIVHTPKVCPDHAPGDGLCEACGRRHPVYLSADCTNCHYGHGGTVFLALANETPFLEFLLDHGLNPVTPAPGDRHELNQIHEDCVVDVLEADPLEARVAVSVDDESLALTVDEELRVTEATRRPSED